MPVRPVRRDRADDGGQEICRYVRGVQDRPGESAVHAGRRGTLLQDRPGEPRLRHRGVQPGPDRPHLRDKRLHDQAGRQGDPELPGCVLHLHAGVVRAARQPGHDVPVPEHRSEGEGRQLRRLEHPRYATGTGLLHRYRLLLRPGRGPGRHQRVRRALPRHRHHRRRQVHRRVPGLRQQRRGHSKRQLCLV